MLAEFAANGPLPRQKQQQQQQQQQQQLQLSSKHTTIQSAETCIGLLLYFFFWLFEKKKYTEFTFKWHFGFKISQSRRASEQNKKNLMENFKPTAAAQSTKTHTMLHRKLIQTNSIEVAIRGIQTKIRPVF